MFRLDVTMDVDSETQEDSQGDMTARIRAISHTKTPLCLQRFSQKRQEVVKTTAFWGVQSQAPAQSGTWGHVRQI